MIGSKQRFRPTIWLLFYCPVTYFMPISLNFERHDLDLAKQKKKTECQVHDCDGIYELVMIAALLPSSKVD